MNSGNLKSIAGSAFWVFVLAIAAAPAFGIRHDEDPCVANETTTQQLKEARKGTAAFNSVEAAEAAGYTNINLPIPNMGDHWVNFELVDTTFEAAKPEALVYADLGNGRLQLVAVEYLAPFSMDGPPSGFAGTCDKWSPFGSPPVFWTLHAWIWEPNLSGTFAKFNPMVP